jgi:hypothetical protein
MERKYIFWRSWQGFVVAILGIVLSFAIIAFFTMWTQEKALSTVVGIVLLLAVHFVAKKVDRSS